MTFSLNDIIGHLSEGGVASLAQQMSLSPEQAQQAVHAFLTHAQSGDIAGAIQQAAARSGVNAGALASVLPQLMEQLGRNPSGPLAHLTEALQRGDLASIAQQFGQSGGLGDVLGGLLRRD